MTVLSSQHICGHFFYHNPMTNKFAQPDTCQTGFLTPLSHLGSWRSPSSLSALEPVCSPFSGSFLSLLMEEDDSSQNPPSHLRPLLQFRCSLCLFTGQPSLVRTAASPVSPQPASLAQMQPGRPPAPSAPTSPSKALGQPTGNLISSVSCFPFLSVDFLLGFHGKTCL